MLDEARTLKLLKPILPDDVQTREGPGGRTLSYVSHAYVRQRLNEIFGIAMWSFELSGMPTLVEGTTNEYHAHGTLTILETSAKYADVGHGKPIGNAPTDHDQLPKTAASDCLKRCAFSLGDQYGLSLYLGDGVTPSSSSRTYTPAAPPEWNDLSLKDALYEIDTLTDKFPTTAEAKMQIAAKATWDIDTFKGNGDALIDAAKGANAIVRRLIEAGHNPNNPLADEAAIDAAWEIEFPKLAEKAAA